MASACKTCQHWQPESSDPRMVKLGFAHCAKRPGPGRTRSAESFCGQYAAAPAETLDARRATARQRVQELKKGA
ncbi:hypothetical protein [Comamonas terrae]|uniref:Phage protein n=1 Tax=Comamonas terrae TaxID=673548 RepID=A0ABW5UKT4_9BURK|nr:hypothetical protein [Comamonas terrae]